jgi:hypothetical protein
MKSPCGKYSYPRQTSLKSWVALQPPIAEQAANLIEEDELRFDPCDSALISCRAP